MTDKGELARGTRPRRCGLLLAPAERIGTKR